MYQFSKQPGKEREELCAEYQFDVVTKTPKNIWIFKEDMKVIIYK
jgi:hypothetical protein